MKLLPTLTSLSILDPKKLNRNVSRGSKIVTLEISSTSIKLMETDGLRIIRWASSPIGPGVFEGEVVADPRAFGATVKQLLTSSGISAKNVIASVSGLYSLSRIMIVPTQGGASASNQTIMEAIKDTMSLSEADAYLAWQTIATPPNGQQVLAIGIPKDMIDGEVKALRSVGINPRTLEFKAIALARVSNSSQALIINVELSSFDIVLVVDNIPEVMRTIIWQPDEFSTEEQAEHLSVALELSIGFYNTHHPDLPLAPSTPLFITGEMSEDSTLIEQLRTMVGHSIEPLKPPIEYPPHMPVSQYAVNIGLALKEMPNSNNPGNESAILNMNLLPRIYHPWKPSLKQISVFLGILAAVAGLIPAYDSMTEASNKTATVKTRYTIVKNELQRRQLELAKRVPLEAAINEYKTIIDMGGGFTEDIQVIRTEAEKLSITLNSITHTSKQVTVGCEANDYIDFRKYIAALEASGRFISVSRPPEQYTYVKGGNIILQTK